MKYSEKSVQRELYYKYGHKNKYFCRNKFIFLWESDVFYSTRSGYLIEEEIKISVADFKKEADKIKKHRLLKKTWEEKGQNLYYKGKIKRFCPNRFNIVCPEGMVTVDEVKELFPYAGLKYVTDRGIVVKANTKVHSERLDMTKVLLDKFYYRARDIEYALYQFNEDFQDTKKYATTYQDLFQICSNFLKKVKI